MSQNRSQHKQSQPSMGLSFAFPLRLPENGTGAGNIEKASGKSWARAKSATRQNLPRR